MTASCVVRDEAGRWLAGRRAAWVASWAGRWALGAAGSVEVGENPAETLTRELEEEWGLVPQRAQVEALVCLSSGLISLIGQAWVSSDDEIVRDAEHDEHAWWPADPNRWPDEAEGQLRMMATLLG
jgi:8-oxo-dGTP pyrophosphatase MutT (NUDIX family)